VFTADAGEVLRDDPSDPMRTALGQVVGVFAELDRRMVVKRLREGREAKAAAGRHAVGADRYGTAGTGRGRTRDAAPHAEEQAAVTRILPLRAGGKSYREISARLDVDGYRPRGRRRGRRWPCATSPPARVPPRSGRVRDGGRGG
jgi:DNA invertase Pin-like site-specific DNA recombinase